MFDRRFAKRSLERAIKTFAQTLIAAGLVNARGILDVDWSGALSVAGLAALVSVLTSVGSGYVGDDTPSLVD